jgi:chromosome segregation ATPase
MGSENDGDTAPFRQLAGENDSLRAELSSTRAAAESLRHDFARSQLRSDALLETNMSLAAQVDSLSTENAVLQGELNFYKSKCDATSPESITDDATRQASILRAQLALAQRQLEARDDENERLRDAAEAEAASRDDVIRKLYRRLKVARSSGQSEVDQMRRKLQELEDEMRRQTSAAKRWEKKCRLLKGKLSDSDEKVKMLTSQLQEVKDDPGFAVERERFESRLRQSEERLIDEREKEQALRAKLQRAEEDVEQLRCYLQLFASDDRRIRQLGADRADVIQEIESLKGRIDRFERTVAGQGRRPTSRRRGKGKRRPAPAWRTFRDYSRGIAEPV